jgi:hypothetical protein
VLPWSSSVSSVNVPVVRDKRIMNDLGGPCKKNGKKRASRRGRQHD